MSYTIAKYIRLSSEDAKTESMSIENQRLLLDRHIASLDLPDAEVIELVDNGHSGTNFERPAVQELLRLVMSGGVNCICVKDFSRFGRNSIEAGYFLERVFPLYRVRFISVADTYDSDEHIGDAGGPGVAFKLLAHEQYSRDLSRKIKSAFDMRKRSGELVSKNGIFGYKLDDNRRMVIDEPAAETVRRIYALALEGKTFRQIAEVMYAEKRLKPGAYKQRKMRIAATDDSEYTWLNSAVRQILNQEQYTGMYCMNRARRVEVGSHNVINLPKEEWTRIPNHHPAIISQEDFDAVRALIDKRTRKKSDRLGAQKRYAEQMKSPLKSKVVCASCGHRLRISATKSPNFNCVFTRPDPDAECNGLRISRAELETEVLRQLKSHARELLAQDAKLKQAKVPVLGDGRELYERFISGEIDREAYQKEKAALDTAAQTIRQIPVAKQSGETLATAKSVLAMRTLKAEHVEAFISRVRVFPDKRVEVEWRV
jgi:hypothetical protein